MSLAWAAAQELELRNVQNCPHPSAGVVGAPALPLAGYSTQETRKLLTVEVADEPAPRIQV